MNELDESAASVGIIGMGEMGRMYANAVFTISHASHRCFTRANYAYVTDRVNVCDRPERFQQLATEYKDHPSIRVLQDGHLVSRLSDFIIYSVEAEFIDRVVAEYGSSTKVGAIVAGQTSVKAPEREAFEKHLPSDVSIISLHSLHGPSVSPVGQALILIKHRGTSEQMQMVEEIVKPLQSRWIYLSYEEHDEVTANTQAVTHAAFLSMGTAWHYSGAFPWESGLYVRGIEVAKINITLRIYSSKWHVYAGLAILNPVAKIQIDQYAKSVTEIFKLMIQEKEDELRERIYRARNYVFPDSTGSENQTSNPVFLEDEVFDQFAIGSPQPGQANGHPAAPPNSHLSLLAIVDSWHQLQLQPFQHLTLAATPIFRLWFGVSEYLFRSPARLEAAIKAAIRDKSHRTDDAEFMVAARGWSQCVSFGDFEAYRRRFENTAEWFKPRFEESSKRGAMMLKELLKS